MLKYNKNNYKTTKRLIIIKLTDISLDRQASSASVICAGYICIHCKHRLFPDYLYLHLIRLSLIIECSDGSYGYNCNRSCDGCLSNSCDKKQGVCTNTTGCKPGWQYVRSVQNTCDIGMLRTCFIIHKKGRINCRNINKFIETMGIEK
jgi:hypothetical protein